MTIQDSTIINTAGLPVFRDAGSIYGNAPALGTWGGSQCLGFDAGGANNNAARRLIYPFNLPDGARIAAIAVEWWDVSLSGGMSAALVRRQFGAGANVVVVAAIGASDNTGWHTTGAIVDHTVEAAEYSYFIRVDFQTESDMSATCVAGLRITYEQPGS